MLVALSCEECLEVEGPWQAAGERFIHMSLHRLDLGGALVVVDVVSGRHGTSRMEDDTSGP